MRLSWNLTALHGTWRLYFASRHIMGYRYSTSYGTSWHFYGTSGQCHGSYGSAMGGISMAVMPVSWQCHGSHGRAMAPHGSAMGNPKAVPSQSHVSPVAARRGGSVQPP